MKITKISLRLKYIGYLLPNLEELFTALTTTFKPFSSLTQNINGNNLAEKMVEWVNSRWPSNTAIEILEMISSAKTDLCSTVEFGRREISFYILNSRTRIRLLREPSHGAWIYRLEVDFGSRGSWQRAMIILNTAWQKNVDFDAFAGERPIEREQLLGPTTGYAASNWLK